MKHTITSNPHFALIKTHFVGGGKTASGPGRRIALVDPQAIAWDGASPDTNCAIWSERAQCWCYARLEVTARKGNRRHPCGTWGLAASLTFTGPDDSGEKHSAVLAAYPTRLFPMTSSTAPVRLY